LHGFGELMLGALRVGSDAIGWGRFGPCPRHELVDVRGRPETDEPVENAGDVGLRLDVVELARFNERGDASPVFRSLVMTSEERVLAIENNRVDAAFDDLGGELDAAVVEEWDKPFPVVRP
jgi:hypothetical protein